MTDYPVPKNAYLAFDGLTIKQKIKDRLNQTKIFTDQNYEGSNLAAFNDAFGMGLSLLVYYLNQSSVNGQFSETTIYENINRIVKELDYKPIGYQTASVLFSLSAEDLNSGFYTIPRYSYISIGGINYSLNDDVSFTKTTNAVLEQIEGIEDDKILYQGTFFEYPVVSPAGNANEIVYLAVDDNIKVDNSNIHVYVKEGDVWEKWSKTQSLYINDYSDKVYEIRFNENKVYEIKFGDDINGKKLSSDNSVVIYYLVTNGHDGEISSNSLEGRKLVSFSTINLQSILSQTGLNYLDNLKLNDLFLNNKFSSSYYSDPESIESIRKNAPGVFRSQFNVSTKKSYQSFIRNNFYNIIQDVVVKNNTEYLDSYIKYYYDLGLTKPQYESRALFNQINYSDSCNFNNVYVFCVPKTVQNNLSYLTPSQKNIILDTIRDEQVLTSETIIADPVYIGFDICVQETSQITKEDINNTELYIIRNPTSRRNESSIKTDVEKTIVNFFDSKNNILGQTVNIQQLNTDLLNIDGVSQLYTRNKKTNTLSDGIKMAYWNPVYFDITISETTSITKLQDFQFPFLNNKQFINRITVK
jgi:hypothetical protein